MPLNTGQLNECITKAIKHCTDDEETGLDIAYFYSKNRPFVFDFDKDPAKALELAFIGLFSFICDVCLPETKSEAGLGNIFYDKVVYVFFCEKPFPEQIPLDISTTTLVVVHQSLTKSVKTLKINGLSNNILFFVLNGPDSANWFSKITISSETEETEPITVDDTKHSFYKIDITEFTGEITVNYETKQKNTYAQTLIRGQTRGYDTQTESIFGGCLYLLDCYATLSHHVFQFLEETKQTVFSKATRLVNQTVLEEVLYDATRTENYTTKIQEQIALRQLSRLIDENYWFNYMKYDANDAVIPRLFETASWYLCIGDSKRERQKISRKTNDFDMLVRKALCFVRAVDTSHVTGIVNTDPQVFLRKPIVASLAGKTIEERFITNALEERICTATMKSRMKKFATVHELLNQMTSEDIEQRLQCEIKWASVTEFQTWVMCVSMGLLKVEFDFGSITAFESNMEVEDEFKEKVADIVANGLYADHPWLQDKMRLAPNKNLLFVWSNSGYKRLKDVKFVRVLTIQDFFDNIDSLEEDMDVQSQYNKFLKSNKRCGFYAFDRKFYSKTMDFPVAMSFVQYQECKDKMQTQPPYEIVEVPTSRERILFFVVLSDILKLFVFKPFAEDRNKTTLRSRYTMFVEFSKGLQKASKTAKTHAFEYSTLDVFIPESEKNSLDKIVNPSPKVKDAVAFKFIESAATDYEVYVRRDVLFLFEEQLKDVPEPIDTINGMNVRAKICLELSNLGQIQLFPDVMRTLFGERAQERGGLLSRTWKTRLRAINTVWFASSYQSLRKAVIVETEVGESGQFVQRVRWPDNNQACFRFCVTMHILDQIQAISVYDKWYKQTFTGEGPVYMKKLYGFMAAKAEEDGSEGWRA